MSNRCVTKACWELRAYPSGRCVFCEAQTFPLKLCQSCTAFALHLLYWHLPAFMTGLKRTPPSYLRELAG